ncbi:MAG: hypothetical protein RR128_08780 [Clostridium sp.]
MQEDLKIKLKLESDSFKKGMNDAKSMLSSFGQEGVKGFGSLGKSLGGVTEKFGGFGKAATVALNVTKKAYDVGMKANKEFIGDLQTVGKVGLKVGAAVGGAFALIAKEGMAFENEMAKVKAITGSTDAEFKKLTETARD